MKLAVLALWLCLANAEPKRNSRKDLPEEEENVSLENSESVNIVPLNDPSNAEDDGENDALEPEIGGRTFLKPRQIVLSRKYAVFPGGTVPIPEGVQQYRRCFGDANLEKTFQWIMNLCAQGLCGDSLQNSGFDFGQSNPLDSILGNGLGTGLDDGQGDGQDSGLGSGLVSGLGNLADGLSSGLSDLASMFDTVLPKNNEEDERMDDAMKEDNEDESEIQRKDNSKKNNSKEKTRKKEKASEQATEKKARKDKGDSKKEVTDKKPNARRKVIPYRRERRELESVTLQFKALPNDQKDEFCEYLENDLLQDPKEVLQTMLGTLQFGDKKESGVHYDRNRGMTLASIRSRTDRESQILKWACQDRREGQRKLYLSTKRFFAAQSPSSRRRRGQRNSEVEGKENTLGDMTHRPEIKLDDKVLKNRRYQQPNYSPMDELAERFNRFYNARSAKSGARRGSRSLARPVADDIAANSDAGDDNEDYISAIEGAKNIRRRAYRNIRRNFNPRTSPYRYLARF